MTNKNSLFGNPHNLFLFVAMLNFSFLTAHVVEGSIPNVRIKVAEYPDEIQFSCTDGGTWKIGKSHGVISKKDRCRIKGKLTKKAIKRFHVIVESVPFRKP
ncbi:hypothetical protein HYY75_08535, partial [bacterium]|nr:hypothetical protein [bacterium]